MAKRVMRSNRRTQRRRGSQLKQRKKRSKLLKRTLKRTLKRRNSFRKKNTYKRRKTNMKRGGRPRIPTEYESSRAPTEYESSRAPTEYELYAKNNQIDLQSKTIGGISVEEGTSSGDDLTVSRNQVVKDIKDVLNPDLNLELNNPQIYESDIISYCILYLLSQNKEIYIKKDGSMRKITGLKRSFVHGHVMIKLEPGCGIFRDKERSIAWRNLINSTFSKKENLYIFEVPCKK